MVRHFGKWECNGFFRHEKLCQTPPPCWTGYHFNRKKADWRFPSVSVRFVPALAVKFPASLQVFRSVLFGSV